MYKFLTLSHLRKVIAAITQRLVGVEDKVDNIPVVEIDTTLTKSGEAADAYTVGSTLNDLSPVAWSGDYDDLSDTPELATVATTGLYSDLTGTPTIPTKTSELTNDSGYIRSASDITILKNKNIFFDSDSNEYNTDNRDIKMFHYGYVSGTNVPILKISARSGASARLTGIATPSDDADAVNKNYVDTAISNVHVPTKTSDLTNDSGFITSYTETDPVFSASAAAGITATDISNWNAKVSDDHKWNDVSLVVQQSYNSNEVVYVPGLGSDVTSGGHSKIASYYPVSRTPSAHRISKYDENAYLNSTTPASNDSSTKVATTAFVKAQGYLTLADLPIYDGTVTTGGGS